MASPASDARADGREDGSRKSSGRFRFKRKQSPTDECESETSRTHRKHRHRHHHHSSKRRKTQAHVTDDPHAYDDSVSHLPPDTAFRESLFDAMGDDEGAMFWEGVYGQPIHNYPNTYRDQDTGELEQMNDEEYAQFVRSKMWEKSWEGIETAKEEKRREREREKQRIREEEKQRTKPEAGDRFVFDFEIESSLRRGEKRKDKKRWKTLWQEYTRRWEELRALYEARKTSPESEQLFLRNKIAWPVESGKRKDVTTEEVQEFFSRCIESSGPEVVDLALTNLVKTERVRWHPDKIQQRYGFMEIDPGTMQGVTAVFQSLDSMWNALRKHQV